MNNLFKTYTIKHLDWEKLLPQTPDLFEDAKKPKKYRRTSSKVV
jgi:hypothetical protein